MRILIGTLVVVLCSAGSAQIKKINSRKLTCQQISQLIKKNRRVRVGRLLVHSSPRGCNLGKVSARPASFKDKTGRMCTAGWKCTGKVAKNPGRKPGKKPGRDKAYRERMAEHNKRPQTEKNREYADGAASRERNSEYYAEQSSEHANRPRSEKNRESTVVAESRERSSEYDSRPSSEKNSEAAGRNQGQNEKGKEALEGYAEKTGNEADKEYAESSREGNGEGLNEANENKAEASGNEADKEYAESSREGNNEGLNEASENRAEQSGSEADKEYAESSREGNTEGQAEALENRNEAGC